jgi:hypothetical protein
VAPRSGGRNGTEGGKRRATKQVMTWSLDHHRRPYSLSHYNIDFKGLKLHESPWQARAFSFGLRPDTHGNPEI